MAKAEKIDAVTELKVIEPAKVALELTEDEAAHLVLLLGKCVSGNPLTDVYRVLREHANPADKRVTTAVNSGVSGFDKQRTIHVLNFGQPEEW